MIDRAHELSVTQQARLLDVSRAAVYYQARPICERDLALMRLIDEIHLEQPHWGTRGVLRMLRHHDGAKPWLEDKPLGRKHVATLMRRMGIEALCPKPGTSRKARGHGHTVYPYLLRKMNITEANEVWAMDTTYVPMRHGFVYLIGVIDVATRRVLAHKLCTTLEAHHAVEIVEQAIARFGTPGIVNTDQGSQFTAFEFAEAIKKRGIRLSMDGKGAWRDNVFVERFWRTVKYERIYKRAYDTVSQARADIAEYIAWYNDKRPHTSLDDRTPKRAYDESRAKQVTITMKVAA
jgi:putative transposase